MSSFRRPPCLEAEEGKTNWRKSSRNITKYNLLIYMDLSSRKIVIQTGKGPFAKKLKNVLLFISKYFIFLRNLIDQKNRTCVLMTNLPVANFFSNFSGNFYFYYFP